MAAGLVPISDDEASGLDLSGKSHWQKNYPWFKPDKGCEDNTGINLYCIDSSYDALYLSNYPIVNDDVTIFIKPNLGSINLTELDNKQDILGLLQAVITLDGISIHSK